MSEGVIGFIALGAVLGAFLGFCFLLIAALVRPSRKPASPAEAKVGLGAVAFGSVAALAQSPGTALTLIVVGAVGSMASDLIGYATGAFSAPANLAWLFVNAFIVYFWHRAQLLPVAETAGFDAHARRFWPVLGRLWLFGLLTLVIVVPIAVAFLAWPLSDPEFAAAADYYMSDASFASAGEPGPAADAALFQGVGISLAFGFVLAPLSIWISRMLLALPATAVNQPQGGLLPMLKTGKGVGLTMSASLWLIAVICFTGVIVVTMVGETVWESIDPAGHQAFLNEGFEEAFGRREFRPLEFFLLDAPISLFLSFYTLWSVSAVTVAYRRWVLDDYGAGHADTASVFE